MVALPTCDGGVAGGGGGDNVCGCGRCGGGVGGCGGGVSGIGGVSGVLVPADRSQDNAPPLI